ncbi:hypothetical protein D6C83_07862 [Aureobasidium pullulans]|uniref:Uncharacterized protein n=1 Tax=Aureobasidium pullulans TaxID=5580 RepID=A0A4T0B067_AURPU|nr:hypothetical protein D6C83_07862 [Aureobasidium pullulans]
MHFNPVAILVGWAVTLSVAVPLDSPVNHEFVIPAVEHADLATMAAITFNNDQALNLTAMFPAALEECLASEYPVISCSNCPRRYNATGYQIRGKTVNQICRQRRRPKMSSSRPFRTFDKYTYHKIRECGQVVEGVDTEPLEHLFWKINHRCHKIWQKGTNQTLSAEETAQADFAAETDHARRMKATNGLTAWNGMTLMSDDEKINTSMFPEAVHGCLQSRFGIDQMEKYDQRNLKHFNLQNRTIKRICGTRNQYQSGRKRGKFAKFERFTFSKIKQCGAINMEPLEHFFWQVNHRCHERWSEDEQRLHGPAAVADGAVDAAEKAEIAAEEAAEEAEDAEFAADGAEADDSDMSDDE